MMNYQSIFDKDPECEFPLRGDVYFWNTLRAATRNHLVGSTYDIDSLSQSLEEMVEILYKLSTGVRLVGSGQDKVPFFYKVGYGMSKGYLCREWWREKALPLLKARLENLVGDCTNGKLNILVLQTDIVKRAEEAVVCPSNVRLSPTGGVGAAIMKAAGPCVGEEVCSIREDEDGSRCPMGDARLTRAGDLACKFLIHTVGPNCQRGVTNAARGTLRDCYLSVCKIAQRQNLSSVAIPSIGTGKNAFPIREAAKIAAEVFVRECHVHPDHKFVFCIPEEKTAGLFRAAFLEAQGSWPS